MTSLISLFVNNSLQNYGLRYCVSSTLLIVKNAWSSKKIFFAPKNTFSGLDDIAGIEKISIAMRKSKKKWIFALSLATNQWLCWFFSVEALWDIDLVYQYRQELLNFSPSIEVKYFQDPIQVNLILVEVCRRTIFCFPKTFERNTSFVFSAFIPINKKCLFLQRVENNCQNISCSTVWLIKIVMQF